MATAAQMVQVIEQALLENPAGVLSVNVDGQTVQWNRSQAIKELEYWKRQANQSAGRRPRVATINLRNCF